MATIILLRHGRTSANASGVLAGWSPDVHLDELGRAQADAAAAAISACCTPERIVASPLVRCQETADALRAASGAAVETDLDLALGVFLGQLLELFGGLALGRVRGHDMAELDGDVLRKGRHGQRDGDQRGKAGPEDRVHVSDSPRLERTAA